MSSSTKGSKCFAMNCYTYRNADSKSYGISFHKFPDQTKNTELFRRWVANCGRDRKPGAYCLLCSRHFEDEWFDRTGQTTRLREGAVPTLFILPEHSVDQCAVSPVNLKHKLLETECLPEDARKKFKGEKIIEKHEEKNIIQLVEELNVKFLESYEDNEQGSSTQPCDGDVNTTVDVSRVNTRSKVLPDQNNTPASPIYNNDVDMKRNGASTSKIRSVPSGVKVESPGIYHGARGTDTSMKNPREINPQAEKYRQQANNVASLGSQIGAQAGNAHGSLSEDYAEILAIIDERKVKRKTPRKVQSSLGIDPTRTYYSQLSKDGPNINKLRPLTELTNRRKICKKDGHGIATEELGKRNGGIRVTIMIDRETGKRYRKTQMSYSEVNTYSIRILQAMHSAKLYDKKTSKEVGWAGDNGLFYIEQPHLIIAYPGKVEIITDDYEEDLEDWLLNPRVTTQEKEKNVRRFLEQLLSVLSFMGKFGFSHNNITAYNIAIIPIETRPSRVLDVRLVNFYVCSHTTNNLGPARGLLDPRCMAPELLTNPFSRPDARSDVCSLAYAITEAWQNVPSTVTKINQRMYDYITNPANAFNKRNWDERLQDLLQRMMEIDPQKRITAGEACKHSYFNAEATSVFQNSMQLGASSDMSTATCGFPRAATATMAYGSSFGSLNPFNSMQTGQMSAVYPSGLTKEDNDSTSETEYPLKTPNFEALNLTFDPSTDHMDVSGGCDILRCAIDIAEIYLPSPDNNMDEAIYISSDSDSDSLEVEFFDDDIVSMNS